MAPLKLYKSKRELIFRKPDPTHTITILTFEIECGVFLLLEEIHPNKNSLWHHFNLIQKFYHLKSKTILFATWYHSENPEHFFIEIN